MCVCVCLVFVVLVVVWTIFRLNEFLFQSYSKNIMVEHLEYSVTDHSQIIMNIPFDNSTRVFILQGGRCLSFGLVGSVASETVGTFILLFFMSHNCHWALMQLCGTADTTVNINSFVNSVLNLLDCGVIKNEWTHNPSRHAQIFQSQSLLSFFIVSLSFSVVGLGCYVFFVHTVRLSLLTVIVNVPCLLSRSRLFTDESRLKRGERT